MTKQRSVFLIAAAEADGALDEVRAELLDEARATLGTPGSGCEIAYDVRYRGQSHELTVRGAALERAADVAADFAQEHERRYGWRESATPIEIVTVRLTAIDPGPELDLAGAAHDQTQTVTGPTVLHLPETTVAVPAGWAGTIDASGTLLLEREA